MTIFLALTGSIGMGKSTTAQMFRDEGIPVHDADATVHKLYTGEAIELVEEAFPGTTTSKGVDRTLLGQHVVGNEKEMKKLEAIIHPLVRREELDFRKSAIDKNTLLAVLDIPLLFETKGQDRVDGIIVVTAPADVQRQRVLDRPGMNDEKFEAILGRQIPDDIKRQNADFIIDTSQGLEFAAGAVRNIIDVVSSGQWKPKESRHA